MIDEVDLFVVSERVGPGEVGEFGVVGLERCAAGGRFVVIARDAGVDDF